MQHWSSVSQQKDELGLQLWVERWYKIKKYRSTKCLLLPCRSIFAAFSLLHFDLSTDDLHLKMKLPFSWMKYMFTQEFFWCLFISLLAWGIKLFILIYFLLGLNWCKDKKIELYSILLAKLAKWSCRQNAYKQAPTVFYSTVRSSLVQNRPFGCWWIDGFCK